MNRGLARVVLGSLPFVAIGLLLVGGIRPPLRYSLRLMPAVSHLSRP